VRRERDGIYNQGQRMVYLPARQQVVRYRISALLKAAPKEQEGIGHGVKHC
jgi:hypothetical protein